MSINDSGLDRKLESLKEIFEYDADRIAKRDLAIKKIWGGNVQEFNQLMAKIEPLTEWKDVMEIIDAEFLRKKIKDDSKEATALTDILFKRYFPSY